MVMRLEMKLRDFGIDESTGLPSNRMLVALAVLGVLLLASAAFSSGRVASPSRGTMSAKAVQAVPYAGRGFESSFDR
jgi:hypothetical protein